MGTPVIGDTPEQLGQITAADAMMVDGKVVTRDDYRALAAQVELFRGVIAGYDSGEISYRTMINQLNETPVACLAQVKAEAGWAGWKACVDYIVENTGCKEFSDKDVETTLDVGDQYAERIRQEVV